MKFYSHTNQQRFHWSAQATERGRRRRRTHARHRGNSNSSPSHVLLIPEANLHTRYDQKLTCQCIVVTIATLSIIAKFLVLDCDELRRCRFAELSDSLNDKEVVEALYQQVKSEIEAGIAYLLRKREEDPYQGFVPRMLYEKTWGKQAPTFKP